MKSLDYVYVVFFAPQGKKYYIRNKYHAAAGL
jgi:hypothetical protein